MPANLNGLVAVTYLDPDRSLDVVLRSYGSPNQLKILEVEGQTLVERLTVTMSPLRLGVVGDADGDGRPEIVVGNYRDITIYEASGDNTYEIIHQSTGYGPYLEGSSAFADTDRDGRFEFLLTQESFPSRVHVIEGIGNDSYSYAGAVTGDGGNTGLAGLVDTDGDGVDEIYFADDGYDPTRQRTYGYESGSLMYHNTAFYAAAVGDTDGNGKGEVLGYSNGKLVILEDSGEGLQPVFNKQAPYSKFADVSFAQDVTEDGTEELLTRKTGSRGFNSVLSIATREGESIIELWDSSDQLPSDSHINSVLAIGDPNGNGRSEVAVLQGGQLHILEQHCQNVYVETWEDATDTAGWHPNTTKTNIERRASGGNPDGYIHSSGTVGGSFDIGALTRLEDATGNFAAKGVNRIRVDVNLVTGNFDGAWLRMRYKDSRHNGWLIPLTRDYSLGSWRSFSVDIDPSWSNDQARRAGWLTDADILSGAVASPDFSITLSDVYTVEVRLSGEGFLEAGIDNFALQSIARNAGERGSGGSASFVNPQGGTPAIASAPSPSGAARISPASGASRSESFTSQMASSRQSDDFRSGGEDSRADYEPRLLLLDPLFPTLTEDALNSLPSATATDRIFEDIGLAYDASRRPE